MKLEIILNDNQFKSTDRLPDWLQSTENYAQQIRHLRETLAMTQAQLGRRSQLHGRVIRHLENEPSNPGLATLKKIAQGLDCELMVRFIPRKSIIKTIQERAELKAKKLVQLSQGTAAMEDQEPDSIYIRHEIKKLTDDLLNKIPFSLWDD